MKTAWIFLVHLTYAFDLSATGDELQHSLSEGESEDFPDSESIDGACPVVCAGHQACIENRCVEMCRPACRPGSYCGREGECLLLPEPDVPLLTEADRQRMSGGKSAEKRVLVFADLGSIVGFGTQLGMEWGGVHSTLARVRLANTGIMSHALFADNEHLRFDWGFGTSFAYRHYEAEWGNLRGFYFGGGIDYLVVSVAERANRAVNQALHSLAPFGEFGYRWVFGDLAVGFGPTLALRYPLATGFGELTTTSCGADGTCEEARRRRFEGTMHLEIGWFQ